MTDVRRVPVLDLRMAYREAGSGDPIVLLHGNPTSSYLWRRVIPHLAPLGRVIAPDLVGMGASDKLVDPGPGSYRFVEHRRYLDALLEVLDVLDRVVLVGHDWGGALLFDWARRHPGAVRGVAHMETIIGPRSWADEDEATRRFFGTLRSEEGERLVLEENRFVELLARATQGGMSDEDLEVYRRPYLEPGESRRPTLTWPREIPFDGEPADVHEIAVAYEEWMRASPVPKLLVRADPGAIVVGPVLDRARSWPNQREVTVRAGHFVPEDAGDEVGRAVADWLAGLP